MTKDPNKNANDMGGPSFHPEIDKEKVPDKAVLPQVEKNDGAILKKDQVPPL